MDIEQLVKGMEDLRALLSDINQAVTSKQLPTLGPIEVVFQDIMALVRDTHAKVTASNPPPASPPA